MIDPESTGDFPEPDDVGPSSTRKQRIGPYQLLEVLGRGGMGIVWLAEQTEPVRRHVALKVIKTGMDSEQVIARFEAERQALAVMDHPNIAKVYDGGTNENGQPYFVMELVKGMPITKYCDQAKLTIRERFELMIPVCHAVQHAHQKGIIHRDLKPSNILIGIYDDRPVPKVIDFGVAKATGPKLTDQTMYTAVGAIIGTLEYMAPEQAQVSNFDIDTRADIYSLGVILYELLAGSPPFSRRQLQSAALNEMLRLVREVEPSKPSTRLSTADELPSLAALRGMEPKRLTNVVRGDLDWIVMKCLEKERDRRYETANGLAMDIQRYLVDEPVLAGPPSATYRIKKFIRRHRGPVIAAGLLVVSLIGGIIGTSWGLVKAERARDAETKQRIRAENNLDAAHLLTTKLMTVTEKVLPPMRGSEIARRDLTRVAVETFRVFAEQRPDSPELRRWNAQLNRYEANIRRLLDDNASADNAYRIALDALRKEPDNADRLSETLRDYATLQARLGQLKSAVATNDDAHKIAQSLLGKEPNNIGYLRNEALILVDRADFANSMGDYQGAVSFADQAAVIFRKLSDVNSTDPNPYDVPMLAAALTAKGVAERERAGYSAAQPFHKEARDLLRPLVDRNISKNSNVGIVFIQAICEYEASRNWLRNTERDFKSTAETNLKEVAKALTALTSRHPDVPRYEGWLAKVQLATAETIEARGRAPEAKAMFDEARKRLERLTAKHADVPDLRADLGRVYLGLGRVDAQNSRSWNNQAIEALKAAAAISPDDAALKKDVAKALALP